MATRAQTMTMIEVMQAYVEGKEVEYARWYTDDKRETTTNPPWNWEGYNYRVKPTPREWWLVDIHCKHFAFPNPQRAHEEIQECCGDTNVHSLIHVREVLDEGDK